MTPAEGLASDDPEIVRKAKRAIYERTAVNGWTHERAISTPMGRSETQMTQGIVSGVTRWEDDPVCRYIVSEHPDGLPLEMIGELLGGISRERVRQIEERALRKVAALLALDGVRDRDVLAWLGRPKRDDEAGAPEPHGGNGGTTTGHATSQRLQDERIAAQEPSEQTMRAEAAILELESKAWRVLVTLALYDPDAAAEVK